ncbi:gastrula zinc finger -like protein [Labeo rohita]|uniref:Gastrula zinc finger-like protein n=1 Tax=Labeo rohita TaxID=84645 RepID=A0A498LIA8_LABRO|nr:gastrula zinc finger -like protein [Labeo rohita]
MRLVTKIVGETKVVVMVGEARSKRSQVVIQRAARKSTVELKKGGAVVEIWLMEDGTWVQTDLMEMNNNNCFGKQAGAITMTICESVKDDGVC